MENLQKDVVILMVLEYNMPDIMSLCLTSKRLNEILCNNDTLWMNKVKKDYPDTFNAVKGKYEKIEWKKLYRRKYNVEGGNFGFVKLAMAFTNNERAAN